MFSLRNVLYGITGIGVAYVTFRTVTGGFKAITNDLNYVKGGLVSAKDSVTGLFTGSVAA